MTVQEAISAFEAATTDLINADAAVTNAQTAQDAAQAKLDTAKNATATASTDDNAKAVAYNGAIDNVVTVLTASKRTTS